VDRSARDKEETQEITSLYTALRQRYYNGKAYVG
jgi:hypothetical protein